MMPRWLIATILFFVLASPASGTELSPNWQIRVEGNEGMRALSDTMVMFPSNPWPGRPYFYTVSPISPKDGPEPGIGGTTGVYVNPTGSLDIGPDGEIYVIDYGNRLLKVFGSDGSFQREAWLDQFAIWPEGVVGTGWKIAVGETEFWVWDHREIVAYDKASFQSLYTLPPFEHSGMSINIQAAVDDELIVWGYPYLRKVVAGETVATMDLREHGLRSATVGLAVYADGTNYVIESSAIPGQAGRMTVVSADFSDVKVFLLDGLPDDLLWMGSDVTDGHIFVFDASTSDRFLYRYPRPAPF